MESISSEILENWGRKVILMARQNVAAQGGPFSAVIINAAGELIAQGSNLVTANNDPTAHAEICAIREACRVYQHFELPDLYMISSCEPCPMCLGAIYWTRIRQVYYLASREDAAIAGFDDAFIYDQLNISPAERNIPFIKIDMADITAPFNDWDRKTDKIKY